MAECSNSASKWACAFCTYLNFPNSLKCTVCLAPRCDADNDLPLTIEEAATRFARTKYLGTHCYGIPDADLSVDDAALAIDEMYIENKRWPCPTCTYHNCLRTRKCVQCYTDRPLRYSSDLSLDSLRTSKNSSPKQCSPMGQLSPTGLLAKALNKWICSACTFLNWPNTIRCTMCYTLRKGQQSPILKRDPTNLVYDFDPPADGSTMNSRLRSVSPLNIEKAEQYAPIHILDSSENEDDEDEEEEGEEVEVEDEEDDDESPKGQLSYVQQ